MTRPRKEQVSLEDTPYYHLVSRCVRRSFLCGVDERTGKSYEHRRSWIEDRIRLLSSIFAIDICSYAVMSNHIHIVVRLNPAELDDIDAVEIAQRWACLFKGPLLFQKWLSDSNTLDKIETETVLDLIEVYRDRLSDLGWFMKCLNEPIARQANKEDKCTGHFWESRYKSQALLSEEALLSCMAYVDLNPIRAGMAQTPESSEHTSIKERIEPSFNLSDAVKQQVALEALIKFDLPLKPLAWFEGGVTKNFQQGILFGFEDYLSLVDFTGRCLKPNKRGRIPKHIAPILERVNIDQSTWLDNVGNFEKNYYARFSKSRVGRLSNG